MISANSTIVGTTVSIAMRTMVSMPLRPRSSTRVSPPVLRSRWKRSDSAVHVPEGHQRQPPHRVHGDRGEHARRAIA